MITYNDVGELIPNFGDYKDPDAYFPYVIFIENKEDRAAVNEMITDGHIVLKNKWRDKVDIEKEILVFDGVDGCWMELDRYAAENIHKGVQYKNDRLYKEYLERRKDDERLSEKMSV